MRFVNDDRVVLIQKAIGLCFGEQNAIGHQADASIRRAAVREANSKADFLAEITIHLLCKSRGDSGAGDIYDDHTYVGPGRPAHPPSGLRLAGRGVAVDDRVRVNGEYGGLGLALEYNRWPGRPESYEMATSQAGLTSRYVEVSRILETVARESGLSGAVYTQITDVERQVADLQEKIRVRAAEVLEEQKINLELKDQNKKLKDTLKEKE